MGAISSARGQRSEGRKSVILVSESWARPTMGLDLKLGIIK